MSGTAAANPAQRHFDLGRALQAEGRFAEAAQSYREALALRPDHAEARNNLGAVLGQSGRLQEAADCFRAAIALRPGAAEPRHNLGNALFSLGEIDAAIEQFSAALRLRPQYWEAQGALGLALQRRGRLDEAMRHCRRAVELNPAAASAHRNLAVVLRESGRLAEAIAAFETALSLKPDLVEALFDLASALIAAGRLDAAAEACRRAIALRPGFAEAHCNLGVALGELGQIDDAIAAVEKALTLKPDYDAAHSTLLFLLAYSGQDAVAIAGRHRHWGENRAARAASRGSPHANDRTPQRRLRIGYVSADFRQHSIAFFLAPILAHHRRDQVEVICYSDVVRPDAMTKTLEASADRWRAVAGQSDAQVAALIREDAIDVLVDLALHSGTNRMLMFARKPAPVQATYLGYPGTTGLAAMDYKLTDRRLDPPGATESLHAERLMYLPECYFCYQPPPGCPEVQARPESGELRFCAFHNLAKVGPQAIRLWSQVLSAVPRSRLFLKARGIGSAVTRNRLNEAFQTQGVEARRVEMEEWSDLPGYFHRLGEMDIALDSTPFNGGTTSCHVLWAGLPLLSLAGRAAVGRMGASILGSIGLSELVADSEPAYVAIARELAHDAARRAALRMTMRERMRRSPLMDAPRFAAGLEAAYRNMWLAYLGAVR